MGMKSFISIKTSPNEYKHFRVSKEVYTYIIQLEMALKDGDKGRKRISKVYEKFKNKLK